MYLLQSILHLSDAVPLVLPLTLRASGKSTEWTMNQWTVVYGGHGVRQCIVLILISTDLTYF
jgi:hypothetical protein